MRRVYHGIPVGHQLAEIRAGDNLQVYKSIQKTTCRNGFPNCPAIKPFSDRLNRLAPAFQALAEYWLGIIGVDLAEHLDYIVDSCPIILAKGPRSGHARVASESCEKSYILLEKSGIMA